MLHQLNLSKILFLDIETVPAVSHYDDLPEDWKDLWDAKTQWQRGEESPRDFYQKRAGILAEFGKVVCISAGYFSGPEGSQEFSITSFFGEDEKKILYDFKSFIDSYFNKPGVLLCAHNGKEFDFPYLSRRMVVNRLVLPKPLDTPGLKPWEISHLDTLELWKFGDRKNFTSLALLTKLLDIPSPKQDMDGSKVAEVFYTEKNYQKIADYCQRDTLAVAQLLLRYMNQPLIRENEVIYK
ncbi:MAG: 3'-5' exonuclease [Schleiferiaceae bacterium]